MIHAQISQVNKTVIQSLYLYNLEEIFLLTVPALPFECLAIYKSFFESEVKAPLIYNGFLIFQMEPTGLTWCK